jgi:magnesium chelatase family protein
VRILYGSQKRMPLHPNPDPAVYVPDLRPLLDRIDLHLEVPALPSADLLGNHQAEAPPMIKERILKVRIKQQERFASIMPTANGHMNHRQIKRYCGLTDEEKKLLKAAIDELGLSARAHDKVLKVSRTIAEAIQYRSLDRVWWR